MDEDKIKRVNELVRQGRDLISEAQTLCEHPVVNESSAAQTHCDVCDAPITGDVVLQAGTVILWYCSRGKLLVTKRFGDITKQDLVLL